MNCCIFSPVSFIDISYLFAFRDALRVMCEKELETKTGPNGVL